MGNVKCQLDKDFATVTEWGEGCPSLFEITLPRERHRLPLECLSLIDVWQTLTGSHGIKYQIAYGSPTRDITPPLRGSAIPLF